MLLYLLRLSVLWGMPRSEIMRKVKPKELLEMIAYDRIEPWSHNFDWYKPALTCATIANANSDGKKQFKPVDFVPDWVSGKKKPKLVDKIELMKMYVQLHNKKVNRNGG